MTSTIHADKIMNSSGDQDSGVDLLVNDQVKIKTANTDRVTVTDATTSISNDLNVDTNTLFVDASTDKVHIGNTSDANTTGLSVAKAGGGNYVARFQNTTAGSPYTVLVQEPSGACAGYPLLIVTNHDGSSSYLRVDSGGRVTMPNQPCFGARKGSSNTSAYQGTLIFDEEDFDVGGVYNTTNGRFTAPVTGKYQLNFVGFGCKSDANAMPTGQHIYVEMQINGTNAGPGKGAVNYFYSQSSTTYPNMQLSQVLSLTANDYVTVVISGQYIYGDADGRFDPYFSGYLIG